MISQDDNALERKLGTKEVFAISTGAMISSGLFVLPAVAFGYLGPSILVAYFLASLFVVPALLAKVELTTAMPKSGGVYFFVARSIGAFFGTFTGFASWFSLSLKSAFALIGIGIFLEPLLPGAGPLTIKLIAIGFTLVFAVLNAVSVKESGRLQFILVICLLAILAGFIGIGISDVSIDRFRPFMQPGWRNIFTVTGLIFISFGGLTKISSIAEEVKSPALSIPRGMISAFFLVTIIYLLALFVTIGVVPGHELRNTLTPISVAASKFAGNPGFIVLAVAAMVAFITTGNAGLLAASRSPLAMARDDLLPQKIGIVHPRYKTPVLSIAITAAFMILAIAFLNLEQLVKVASTMKLILFLSANVSVIVMRKSGVVSYRPTFKSPMVPLLPIIGSIIYVALIVGMGAIPLLVTLGFFALSSIWYLLYARSNVKRDSAFVRMAKEMTNKELESDENQLESELIEILRDRDEVQEDRFDEIVRGAVVLDIHETMSRDDLFTLAAKHIAKRWKLDASTVRTKLNQREAESPTLLYPGVAVPHAVPHVIVEGSSIFDIVLIRNKSGIVWNDEGEIVYTAFCLVGSADERNFHLKALMSIAQILQDPEFHERWMKARTEQELRTVLLLSKRKRE
jgi:basic amino acid/polyamine antiporter, APA family